jgi:hypothetical protein
MLRQNAESKRQLEAGTKRRSIKINTKPKSPIMIDGKPDRDSSSITMAWRARAGAYSEVKIPMDTPIGVAKSIASASKRSVPNSGVYNPSHTSALLKSASNGSVSPKNNSRENAGAACMVTKQTSEIIAELTKRLEASDHAFSMLGIFIFIFNLNLIFAFR